MQKQNGTKNVLSLFDGISCGQVALNRAGVKYDKYYSSEVDKYAIQVTQENFPDTIQVGDVKKLNVKSLGLFLLMGGSPCTDFSFAGKQKGMATECKKEIRTLKKYLRLKKKGFQFKGESYLFWEFIRVLRKAKPKYFLLENVMMSKKWQQIITKAIGVEPIEINSALVSAQNRKRLYWTNIPNIEQPKDKGILLEDIIETNGIPMCCSSSGRGVNGVQHRVSSNLKAHTLTKKGYGTRSFSGVWEKTEKENSKPQRTFKKVYLKKRITDKVVYLDGETGKISKKKSKGKIKIRLDKRFNLRKMSVIELERLQTLKDGYTNCVSKSNRTATLGNGWTVDVIAHIMLNIKDKKKKKLIKRY